MSWIGAMMYRLPDGRTLTGKELREAGTALDGTAAQRVVTMDVPAYEAAMQAALMTTPRLACTQREVGRRLVEFSPQR